MPEQSDAPAKSLEIKKYANRRYYDATHSRHVTLEEIQTLVQQGFDIRVTDGRTGADLTAQVLTQIILELDTPKLDSLPVPLLLRLIRMNDSLVKDFIEKYFNQALKSFFEQQQKLEERFRQFHGLPTAFSSMSQWTQAMLQPFASALKGGAGDKQEEAGRTPAAPSQEQELRDLVQKLQGEVARLRGRGAAAKAGRRRRK